jgi:hypothetical protein
MQLALIFLFFGMWLYVFWAIWQLIGKWKAKRDYHNQLHPKKKRHLRPFRRSVANTEPKRRISYRPPNKDA